MTYYNQLAEQMASYYTSLAGCAPDQASDVMIRMRVLASQLDTYCQEAEETARQAFPATATGEALDRHAALRGLTRKDGAKARGMVAFQRSAPAGYQILIPAGTVVQSQGPEAMQFVTVKDATLGATLSSVIVQVEAVAPGSQYNLKTGSVTVMVTPPPGITQLRHITACQGGADPESDEELRARLLDACRNPVIGWSAGYYQGLALAQAGVGRARVLPVHRGNGTVDVVVYGGAGSLGSGRIAEIQALFQAQREMGIDVLVREPQTIPVDMTLTIAVKEGWDFSAVRAVCDDALSKEIGSLGIGEPWLRARMYRVVMSQDGVYNCAVTEPAADVIPAEDRLVARGQITIGKMEVGG